MGESIYLFGWLVTRQTKNNGLVFGGHAFTYPEISEDAGWPVRTIERWMARQRSAPASARADSSRIQNEMGLQLEIRPFVGERLQRPARHGQEDRAWKAWASIWQTLRSWTPRIFQTEPGGRAESS
jgi:hypothetical protein